MPSFELEAAGLFDAGSDSQLLNKGIRPAAMRMILLESRVGRILIQFLSEAMNVGSPFLDCVDAIVYPLEFGAEFQRVFQEARPRPNTCQLGLPKEFSLQHGFKFGRFQSEFASRRFRTIGNLG